MKGGVGAWILSGVTEEEVAGGGGGGWIGLAARGV